MKLPLAAVLMGSLLLTAGCASRMNPVHWFGGHHEKAAPTLAPKDGYPVNIDPRPLVDRIAAVHVDKTPEGIIVTATALPPTQGYWSAELVPTARTYDDKPAAENGVMTLDYRIMPPRTGQPVGSKKSREITAAFFLSNQTLASVKKIVVNASQNQLSARP